jgi:hypothetical protein
MSYITSKNKAYLTSVFVVNSGIEMSWLLQDLHENMPWNIYKGVTELIYNSFTDIPIENMVIGLPCFIFYSELIDTKEIVATFICTPNSNSFAEDYKEKVGKYVGLFYACVLPEYMEYEMYEKTLICAEKFLASSNYGFESILTTIDKDDTKARIIHEDIGFYQIDEIIIGNHQSLVFCKKISA